jgi:hypothetical protein
MLDGLALPDLPIDLADLAKFDLLASLVLLAGLLSARGIVAGAIRGRADLAPQVRRRWLATSCNLFLFGFLLGLVLIWAPQLRTLALSLTAGRGPPGCRSAAPGTPNKSRRGSLPCA